MLLNQVLNQATQHRAYLDKCMQLKHGEGEM